MVAYLVGIDTTLKNVRYWRKKVGVLLPKRNFGVDVKSLLTSPLFSHLLRGRREGLSV